MAAPNRFDADAALVRFVWFGFRRWRGSIYKLVWLDLLCFLFIYYVLNIIYRTALDAPQKV